MIMKKYPYLREQFKNHLNAEQQRRQFLAQLDNDVNQKQYILITLLDWKENPIKEIQGEISGGSLSVDGASPVRRAGSLSCTISSSTYDMDSLNMDFSLNKKVFIEIGIKNKTTKYQDPSDPENYWPILWFPQGVFLITDFSLNSSSSSSLNLSISIKDKMALLNGDVGGRLPAFVRLDEMDTQLSTGEETSQKVLVFQIILELVNHFGGEQISNIVIEDVPLRVRQVVKWNGTVPLWGKKESIYGVFEAQLGKAKEEEKAAKTALDAAKKAKDDAESDYDTKKAAFDLIDTNFQKQKNDIKTLIDEIKDLNRRINDLNLQISENIRTINNPTTPISNERKVELESKNTELRDSKTTLENDRATKRNTLKKLNEQFKLFDSEISEDDIDAEKMNTTILEEETKDEKKEKSYSTLKKEYDDAKVAYEEAETAYNKIIDIYNKAKSNLDDSQRALDANTVSGVSEVFSWTFSLERPSDPTGWTAFDQGVDVGYVYTDFVLSDELNANAGTSITTMLDEIKNTLGNYEYFYDVFGVFHFREIKNYLNITQAQIVEEDMKNPGRAIKFAGGNFLLDQQSENQYLIETTNSKSIYSFNDDTNITSLTVTPQYGNIKNDYVILGLKESTTSDIKTTIRYRLAIDDKPEKKTAIVDNKEITYYIDKYEDIAYYYDEAEGVHKLACAEFVDSLPSIGVAEVVYVTKSDNQGFMWDSTQYIQLYYIDSEDKHQSVKIAKSYYPKDWRTALYLYGLVATVKGLDTGPYFEDLQAFWPKEYNLDPDNQHFVGEEFVENSSGETVYSTITHDLTNGTFFLDFIDANSSQLGMYSVNAIGRREDIVSDDKINCLFIPEIPDVVFLNISDPNQNWTENTAGIITDDQLNDRFKNFISDSNPEDFSRETKMLFLQRHECEINNQPWAQVKQDIYGNLAIGGYTNSAYEALRYELFCHTRYQKSVSLTSIPVYYLDANSRIELSSKSTGVYGSFMVQSINFSFGPGANMSVTLNETAERL